MIVHIFIKEKKIYFGIQILLISDVSLVCFQKVLKKKTLVNSALIFGIDEWQGKTRCFLLYFNSGPLKEE